MIFPRKPSHLDSPSSSQRAEDDIQYQLQRLRRICCRLVAAEASLPEVGSGQGLPPDGSKLAEDINFLMIGHEYAIHWSSDDLFGNMFMFFRVAFEMFDLRKKNNRLEHDFVWGLLKA